MNKKDVSKYAHTPTLANQLTTIHFKDKTELNGHFRPPHMLEDDNKWNFIVKHQADNKKDTTILNGDDFESIVIS